MKITTFDKPIKEQKEFLTLVESGDYFKEMDFAIQNSPTATMAVLMFKKYCELPNLKSIYSDLWEKIKDEKIKYGYFTLWVEYTIDLEVKNVHFRLNKNYRAKKSDDVGNVSQYLNVVTKKVFPAFNNNKIVLKAQIEKAGGFEKFSGQIFQYNTTSQPYEITPLFSVLNWMKAEHDTPNHISASADNSLFGNNVFLMKKGADTSTDGEITNTDKVIGALRSAKSTKNSGTNHFIEMVADNEVDLSKAFLKVPIGNDIEIDKFNNVDDKAGKKIATACYCFPQILANPSEGLFGNSGDAMQQAITYWKSTCEFEANKINDAFKSLGILLQEKIEEVVVEQDRTEEQKALMAFAGSFTNVIALQTSIKQGVTSYDSAISMLVLFYGFKEQEAKNLIGTSTTTPLTTPTV